MSPTNHRHERVGEEIAHEINAMLAGGAEKIRAGRQAVVVSRSAGTAGT